MRVVNIKTGLLYTKRWKITRRLTSRRLDMVFLADFKDMRGRMDSLDRKLGYLERAFENVTIIDKEYLEEFRRLFDDLKHNSQK